jgi:hypothetical protein
MDTEDEVVTPLNTGVKIDLVYAIVIDQGQLDTGLAGGFPVRSIKGIWYTMVVYSFYCYYVLVVPMKSCALCTLLQLSKS